MPSRHAYLLESTWGNALPYTFRAMLTCFMFIVVLQRVVPQMMKLFKRCHKFVPQPAWPIFAMSCVAAKTNFLLHFPCLLDEWLQSPWWIWHRSSILLLAHMDIIPSCKYFKCISSPLSKCWKSMWNSSACNFSACMSLRCPRIQVNLIFPNHNKRVAKVSVNDFL